MSINGHNTGSFDQPPLSAPTAKPTHDFLGSPVHDRGAFSYFNAWDIYAQSSFNQIAFARHIVRLDLGTNAEVLRGREYPLQIRSTVTGIDLIPAGIYGAVFARENLPAGADPADNFAARLVGANGSIVNVSAPDNAAGYALLPPGIISQESNGVLDANGQVIGPASWGALNAAPLVTGGNFCWFYVFDSRILLGGTTAFRPQFVQPLACFYKGFDDGAVIVGNNSPFRNFYSVPFKTVTGFYVQSAPPTYPPKFSFPATTADKAGFPPEFQPTGQTVYPYTD